MASRKRSTNPKGKWHSNDHEPFTLEQRLNVCRKWLRKNTDTYIDWSEGQKVVASLLVAHFPFDNPKNARMGTAIHAASRQIFSSHKGWKRQERQKAKKRNKRGRSKPQATESVYVIGPKDGRYVKIGRSANPRKRFASLQTGYPEELYVYHVFPTGDMGLEQQLHKRFKDYRSYGEWFYVEGDVADWIEDFGEPVAVKDW